MISVIGKDDAILHNELEEKFLDIFLNGDIANSYIHNPFIEYIVFEENNEVIGVLCYTIAYQKMEIIQINVLLNYQNKKVASKMMEYLFELAFKSNVENITLEVKEDNIPAIKLYEKYGFKKIAKRLGYYQGIDAILMEKEMIK